MNLRTLLPLAAILLASSPACADPGALDTPVATGIAKAGPTADPAWDNWETRPATKASEAGRAQAKLAPGENGRPSLYKEGTGGPLARISLAAIGAYQALVSPLLRTGCRFNPSCSRYASRSIAVFGLVNGVIMGTDRISRCHPFAVLYGYRETAEGLLDDPPESSPAPLPPLAWLEF